MSDLSGKTILIAGGGGALGLICAAHLATRGARLVLADADLRRVMPVARRWPERIELIQANFLRPEVASRVGAIWEAEPLHAVVDMLPLGEGAGATEVLSGSHALALAFRHGLRAGQGRFVLVDGAVGSGPVEDALAACYARFAQSLGAQMARVAPVDHITVDHFKVAGRRDGADVATALAGLLADTSGALRAARLVFAASGD